MMKTILIFLIGSFSIMAYSQKPIKLEWEISFKKNHVVFECSEGCNYLVLSFDACKKVILNENTIVDLEKNPEELNSDFLVQYSKTGNKITLEGIKGIEWKNITLTSDLKSKYYINQTGQIKKTTI